MQRSPKTKMINAIMLQIFRKKCESQQKQKRSMESCYKSFVKNAIVNKNKSDQSSQKITSKPHTKAPQCHWLPATRFQRVLNPEPNTLHNAVQIMFKAEYIYKNYAFSRFDHKTMRKKTHQNELDGWKHDGWALASG